MDMFIDSQTKHFDETISFSSIFQNISYAEKIITTLNSRINISDEIFGNILLSLSEAINNAIVHGNKFNKDKFVFVNYKYKNKLLVFEIKDEGDGFDPDEIADPTADLNVEKLYGRGVFIIISLSDKVEFEYSNGQIIRMYFNL
ncbi:MAG: ATP-binding protein [Bacteroidales bacterium]|nr:ATP-binding protein [Bacteroidales bacterium]